MRLNYVAGEETGKESEREKKREKFLPLVSLSYSVPLEEREGCKMQMPTLSTHRVTPLIPTKKKGHFSLSFPFFSPFHYLLPPLISLRKRR
jgi:hypothetical protein